MTTEVTTTKRSRGRPANLVPCVEWSLQIPHPLAVQVELLCLDPVRQKPAFGARSAYLIRLIREDFARRGIIIPEISEKA